MRFCQKEDGSSSSSLCSRCKAMTTTVTGLKQLFSRKGYLHPYPAIKNGVSQGCPFCTFLQELALLRSEEVPYPVCISCTFLVDGSNEFNNLVYRESSCSDDQFQSLYKMLPPMAFRPGMYLSLQGHVYGPDYCASLDVNTLTESDTELLDTFMPVDIESDSRLVNDILGIIKTCQAHHTLCPSISNLSLLPCRVIDVRSPGQNPSLHISHKNETGTYLALSYCWGGPQRVMLTRTSQATMQREISFVSLPKTVREAIAVCRALNYQYIWIDSLCIVQDCEEDKATQINAMGTIFAQAALTIMASNTPSVELGFLNQARPSHSCDIPFLLPNGETIVVRCSLSPPSYTNDANPTSRRGWIFQEDVLSVRELQFQSMSIRWVCGEKVHNFTSSMRNYTPELKSVIPAPWTLPTKASYSEIEEWWQSLVMAYSSREFTFWGDRLPALSGIITYLKPMLGKHNTYLAGLWKDSMIQQLAWMRNPGYPLKTVQPVPTKRLAGPTWSWISISSIVSIPPNNPVLPNPSSAILVSCTIELMNSATPFGNVKEGILVLEACVAPGPREEIRSEISGKINIHWDCEENSQNPAGGDLMDIWLVLEHKDMTQGSRIYALILRPIGDGRFRRVAAAVVQQDIEHLVWPYPNNRQRITII